MKKSFFCGLMLSALAPSAFAAMAPPKLEPSGIYCLISGGLSPSNPIGTQADHPSLSNMHVDGIRVRAKWLDVQPTNASTYNWTEIDAAVALAAASGKKIGISVNAGAYCPKWLYDVAGAVGYAMTGGDAGKKVPVPSDPAYIANWIAFIAAFGARYDSNPNVAYIVMTGFGDQTEWYQAGNATDTNALQALSPPNPPGTAKWIAQAKTFITAYNDAFQTTPFIAALAKPFSNAAGLRAEKDVVVWATATYPDRFGVMNNTLNAKSSLNFYPNEAVNTYRTTNPAGFQMLWAYLESQNPDGTRLGGTLEQCLTIGVNFGGKFVEVYEPDVDNPDEQTVLATKKLLLKANAVMAPSEPTPTPPATPTPPKPPPIE